MYNEIRSEDMKKVLIERLDHQFRGIGYLENKVVFVPKVIPFEECEILITKEKKKYQEGRLKKVLTKSEDRIEAKCPYYNFCGGCSLEHISYSKSVQWKSKMLTELFLKHNLWKEEISVVLSGHPWSYRNKITLKVQNGKLGFYSLESHDFVPIQECLITMNCINRLVSDFSLFSFVDGELMIRCNENEELLIDIITSDEVQIDEKLYERHKIAGVLVNHKCIYGKNYFFERKSGVLYQVSYDSFFQINPYMSSKMFFYIRQLLEKCKNVLDLYCGVGTIGFQILKPDIYLVGIEVVPNAILNALKNAKLNHFSNCQFHLGKVEDILFKINSSFDVIIVDPPRSGLDKKTIQTLLKIKSPQILYVSCNPQTLIRDLNLLKNDYQISSVLGFDMFPYTNHVECVCVMSRR